ncbi:hypothetical protein SPRG_03600 [Saprolegnia parasitica CBS 223.65]|uniref:Uncharacterized protein n=1 Tax=Saprolegnia parasitica (strain CBS 223.65) TaxID=695850 RepID=A0A067CY42_SAPPC|nr:hypothetical protein SPRG_03600 [Saprolegnia parasitica CBS 223.65]KDO31682.1 hypothetical protein SPRG_03600 [Saprolegnia parasitica CBS 223.65]|eukprot:XP_012197568.1 hypothetical protein SPRG_03600 [Saprolegnia parasitica CBS 223.65]
MDDDRDVVQSGAIFRMKQADLRWRSPMPMSMLKKSSIGADRELPPATPTKAQASAGSSTPRSAFDSLCLRSPLPKVLLQKLQGSAQKAGATKSPFASTIKTPPTQKKIKLVFKPASAMKLTPSEAKPVAHSSTMVDPKYETPTKAMRPSVQTSVETKTLIKDSTPLGLSDQLALLQRQKLQKNGTTSTVKPVAAAASMPSTTIEFFTTPEKTKTRDATPSPAQAAASHAVAEAMAAVPMTPVPMTPAKPDEGPTNSFLSPPTAQRRRTAVRKAHAARVASERSENVASATHSQGRDANEAQDATSKGEGANDQAAADPAKPKTPKPKTPKPKTLKIAPRLPTPVRIAHPLTPLEAIQEPTLLLPRPKTPKKGTKSSAPTPPASTPTDKSATALGPSLPLSRQPTPVKSTTKGPTPRRMSSVVEPEQPPVERDDEDAAFEFGGGSAASSEVEALPTPPKKPAPITVATPSVAKATPTSSRKRLKRPDARAGVAAAEASDDDLPMLATSSPERTAEESAEEVVEHFQIKDRRVEPLAVGQALYLPKRGDENDDEDDDEDKDDDDGASRRISDEFAKEMRGLNESDLVVDDKTVELHKWSVVWPPRMKSATNIILTVRGCNGSKDGPVTSVVYKSYQSPRHFLSTADDEVHLVGTMATKSVPIPSVRAFFKAGIPRMWRAKVPSLLVASYVIASSDGTWKK